MDENAPKENGARLWWTLWHDPMKIGAIIAFLASGILNISQYITHGRELDQKFREHNLQEQKWDGEQRKLNEEIEKLRRDRVTSEFSSNRKVQLLEELEQAKSDIQAWDNGVFKSRITVLQLQGRIGYLTADPKATHELKGAKENLALTNTLLMHQQQELESAKRRRSEIEAQLR